jgi:hypothetical protein
VVEAPDKEYLVVRQGGDGQPHQGWRGQVQARLAIAREQALQLVLALHIGQPRPVELGNG